MIVRNSFTVISAGGGGLFGYGTYSASFLIHLVSTLNTGKFEGGFGKRGVGRVFCQAETPREGGVGEGRKIDGGGGDRE